MLVGRRSGFVFKQRDTKSRKSFEAGQRSMYSLTLNEPTFSVVEDDKDSLVFIMRIVR
jgi:hypothetical protein